MAHQSQTGTIRRLFLTLAVSAFAAASAVAGTVSSVLVDNLSSPVSSVRIDFDEQIAQAFETGGGTYLLDKVTAHLGAAVLDAQAEILIHLDNGGLPGAVLVSLNQRNVTPDQLQDYEFLPPGDISLQPNTRYWVVVRNVQGELDWATRAASAAGILDEEAVSTDNGITWVDSNVANRYFMLKVEGCLVPRATIVAAQATEPGSGTKQMDFTVNLSGPPGQDVTVLATTADGTALGGSDFVALTDEAFLFTAGGSTTRTISVTLNEDDLVEDNESFTLTLAAADPKRLLFDQPVATGTIVDSDAALFDDFEDNMDDGWYRYNPLQSATFTVSGGEYRLQAGASPQPSLYRPGRAAALRQDHTDSDFVLGVKVAAWDPALDLGFGLIARAGGFGDNLPEGYAFLYLPNVAEARIVRFDNEYPKTLGSAAVSLDSTGQYWFEFTGEGDAMEGKIFSGDNLAVPLVTVAASDDRYSNSIVGIYASSRPPFGATAVDVTFDSFLASTAVAPLLSVGADDADKAEGASGSVTHSFEITRGGNLDAPVTVDWAVTGGEADLEDFGGAFPSGSVAFNAGETVKSISLTTTGDGIVELDEGYDLAIVSATGRAVTLESVARGVIRNDDSAALSIGFGTSALQVREGQAGARSAVTGLTLSSIVDADVDVVVSTADFTATVADNDYVSRSGATVTIPAGQTFLPVALTVNGDVRSELAFEVFQVRVDQVNAGGRDISVAQALTSVSIQDDDISIAISGGPAETVEGGGAQGAAFTYTVSVSSARTADLDLDWAVTGAGDNPASAADFVAASGTVTIPAGQTSASLIVTANGDYDFEPRESFQVTVSAPGSAMAQSAEASASSARGIAKQSGTAVIGASGGLDGSGRILLPDAAAAADNHAIVLAALGAGANPATLFPQFQNGAALENYDSLVASGQLVELARFAVDSSNGHAGAYNGAATIAPAADWTRAFLFAFNASTPAAATAGGIFGNLADWIAPTAEGQSVSLDGRLASEAYWGQLKPSGSAVDLEMATLPGASGGEDIAAVSISGSILNDDELAVISPPDAGNVIQLNHAGRPNSVYELQISDDLVNWVTLETVTTDAAGAAAWQETRLGKLARRFYRFRLSGN